MALALSAILWAAAAIGAAAVCYLWAWALVGLLPRGGSVRPRAPWSKPEFVIVIPAHNEERRLPALVECLRRLDYPPDRYEVWVVADNCTDGTVGVAQREGVRCICRDDLTRVGKGYALGAAFEQACQTEADAVIVVDVDSAVSPNLLQAFAERLEAIPGRGEADGHGPTARSRQRALQASNRLLPGETPQSLLLAAESVLEDRLFCGAKARMGMPVLLRGNGMCLATSLLRERRWEAFSLAEDVEYGASLLAAGERPGYVADAQVTGIAPLRSTQMAVQRLRWGRGHRRVALRRGPRLLWKGLKAMDLRLCDAAVGLFVTSKSMLAAWCVGTLAVTWLLRKAVGGGPAWLAGTALMALAGYCCLGVMLCRPTARQLALAALAAPWVLCLRTWVHLRSVLSSCPPRWTSTPY